MENFKAHILQLISLKREGDYWDFKEVPHDNNASLLHDILCLANTLYTGERYLIFGVTDPADGCRVIGLSQGQIHRKTQAQYIDFLRSKPFAGHFRPEIELRTTNYGQMEIDVLVVLDRPYKPYYLTQKYAVQGKEVRANHIYTRVNDSNTPINSSADLYLIEKMWRQRLGLDLPPGERMRLLLRQPDQWFKDIGNKDYLYHRQFPEFNVKLSEPEAFQEAFSFFFTNEKSYLGTATFKYHTTTLFELEYMYCDEMRKELAVPQNGHLRINEESQWYYYYDMSTPEGDFLYFLTDGKLDFQDYRGSIGGPFLVFSNDVEKQVFDNYLLNHLPLLEQCDDFWGENAVKRIQQANAEIGSTDPVFVSRAKQIYDKWIQLQA